MNKKNFNKIWTITRLENNKKVLEFLDELVFCLKI